MEGKSLLGDNLDTMRPVFSIGGVTREVLRTKKDTVSRLVGSGPPLYGMKTMQLTVCDRWYSLVLATGRTRAGKVPNHPRPCDDGQVPTRTKARDMIVQHLTQRGFVVPLDRYPALTD
jgi:hypothetical protein